MAEKNPEEKKPAEENPAKENAPEEKRSVVRPILDDLFDAYTILGKGNYVSLYDIKGNMTRYSPAYVELFGLKGEYVPTGADDWSDLVHPEDLPHYTKVMGDLLKGNAKNYDISYRVRLKDGSYALMRFLGTILRDSDGNPELIGGITINEGLMENTDPVTVLRNQYGFFQDLKAAIELKKSAVMLLIKIFGMGNINTSHGYGYGNNVLRQTGWLLQETFGQSGTVYRMEGAKFAVFSEQLSKKEAAEKYEEIRLIMSGGLPVGDVRQTLTVSCGMLALTGKVLNEQTIHSSLNYACKESYIHKNGHIVDFDGAPIHGHHGTLEMIDAIRRSALLKQEGFSLHYQPIVLAKTEKIVGVEALLRWENDQFGKVPPSEYVPVLERDFVFGELGYWILGRAMTDGLAILKRDPYIVIGVNIAQSQIEDDIFVQEVRRIAARVGFPLKNLCLELTRGCRLLEIEALRRPIDALRQDGVLFIIDDFATGRQSIESLLRLSPDCIKFDRQFIGELEESKAARDLMRGLIDASTACGASVCLKGIETRGVRDIVRGYSARFLQGHYYAKAMPLNQLIDEFLTE